MEEDFHGEAISMLELYKNIKRIREEKGMSQEELARLVGFKSRSSINKIEMGVNDITQSKLVAIANALGVSPGELMGVDEPASSAPPAPQKSIEASPTPKVAHYTYRIPVIDRVAVGQPILAQEEIIDYEYIDERLHKGGDQYFGLVVKDTSMEPTIHDGDTIIVRVQEDIESGQIAVVLVDGEDATIKEVKESEDGLTLIGHNVAVYPPHFYSREEVEKLPVRIIGRVIQSISKF